MVLKSVGVLSCGKVLGILYGLLGLLIGLPIVLFSLIGAVASTGSLQSGSDGLIFGTLFGVGPCSFSPSSTVSWASLAGFSPPSSIT